MQRYYFSSEIFKNKFVHQGQVIKFKRELPKDPLQATSASIPSEPHSHLSSSSDHSSDLKMKLANGE